MISVTIEWLKPRMRLVAIGGFPVALLAALIALAGALAWVLLT